MEKGMVNIFRMAICRKSTESKKFFMEGVQVKLMIV